MLITSALPNCYPAGEDADVGKTFIKNQPDKSKIIFKKKKGQVQARYQKMSKQTITGKEPKA